MEAVMPGAPEGIRLFAPEDDQRWYQAHEREIFLRDAVDATTSDTMSVGFARYAAGESNEWVVTYDEALIVTKGALTVSSATGHRTTATTGKVIYLSSGTKVIYSAEDTGAEVVYVTYPHWIGAMQASPHAALLDTFHAVDGAAQPWNETTTTDNVDLMRSIWGPLERGESHDFQPFYDALADDVVFTTPVGELHGKAALSDYFANASATIEFQPFIEPLQYYGQGDRVVILGAETFKVKESGLTHRADWAWVVDLRGGLITRIVAIQHLAGIAGIIEEALANARRSSAV